MSTTDDNVKAAQKLIREYAERDLARLLALYGKDGPSDHLLFEERTALRDCLADLANNSEET
jgi:hypothetical protein